MKPQLRTTSANFGEIDLGDEVAELASRPVDVAGAKSTQTLFVIAFAMAAAGVQGLWIAFLVWLAIRAIF